MFYDCNHYPFLFNCRQPIKLLFLINAVLLLQLCTSLTVNSTLIQVKAGNDTDEPDEDIIYGPALIFDANGNYVSQNPKWSLWLLILVGTVGIIALTGIAGLVYYLIRLKSAASDQEAANIEQPRAVSVLKPNVTVVSGFPKLSIKSVASKRCTLSQGRQSTMPNSKSRSLSRSKRKNIKRMKLIDSEALVDKQHSLSRSVRSKPL